MARLPMPHIIVLLPGITGSVLKRRSDGETIWGWSMPSLGKALLTGGRFLRKSLALPEDPHDKDDLNDGIVAEELIQDLHLLPGFWKIDGYSKISDAILDRFQVTKGENFIEFPYDWRRDNRVAARKLQKKSQDWLEKWRTKSGNKDARLILVAHSMGGIVARYFLEVLEGWKQTHALVTFGTPFRGSLNALNTLANGMRKGPFGLIELSEVARQFTSIYQLLPIYECYDQGDGKLVRVDEAQEIPNVDPARAADALKFHREIQSKVKKGRYAIHPVVGLAQPTNQSACLTGGKVEMLQTYKSKDMDGDGTVPRVSAVPIELSDNPKAMYAATQHGSLQNADAVLVQLGGILGGSTLDLGSFKKPREPKVNVAVEVEDLFWKGEPISIRARPTTPGATLNADLYATSGSESLAQISLRAKGSGWLEGAFEDLAAGGYRVRINGANVEPAESAFVVADIGEEQAASEEKETDQ